MAVVVDGRGTAFETGASQTLIGVRPRSQNFQGFLNYSYDVAQDGRFLINTLLDDENPITLLVNWPVLNK